MNEGELGDEEKTIDFLMSNIDEHGNLTTPRKLDFTGIQSDQQSQSTLMDQELPTPDKIAAIASQLQHSAQKFELTTPSPPLPKAEKKKRKNPTTLESQNKKKKVIGATPTASAPLAETVAAAAAVAEAAPSCFTSPTATAGPNTATTPKRSVRWQRKKLEFGGEDVVDYTGAAAQDGIHRVCPLGTYGSGANLKFKTRADRNLYGSPVYGSIRGKKSSFRTYLNSSLDSVMLNNTVDGNFNPSGTWMNTRNTDNNIPFKTPEIKEFLNAVLEVIAPTDVVNKTINGIKISISARVILVTKGSRSVSINLDGSLSDLRFFQNSCQRALDLLHLLENRYRQRVNIQEFILNSVELDQCCCCNGYSHVSYFYYSKRVSKVEDILPIEWVYKNM